jgi:hypothetical protein
VPREISIAVTTALFWLGGCCHTASFTAIEKGFVAGPRRQAPVVFLDRLPRAEYRRVGFIEVARPNSTPLGEFVDAARVRGAEVGCDVVIDAFVLGEEGTYHCRDTPVYGAPECCTRAFVCGAYRPEAPGERIPSPPQTALGGP